ncbi:hypothetical protein MPSEU_000903600 [Mayamaea pseudoterrestris]|nr:hypothetical protein MPSEU_000903600 [Mayamaea pseudoterrestris]
MSINSPSPTGKASFVPTCDLFDRYPDDAQVPELNWRSFGKRKQFCGKIYTIQCPCDDNSRVKETLELDGYGYGRVLIVNVIGRDPLTRHDCAMMGAMLAKAAVKTSWEGVIVNGRVRDVDELAQVDLGILALGCTPRKSVRRGSGEASLPVDVGGVTIYPGDLVFADNDGVVVMDPAIYRPYSSL